MNKDLEAVTFTVECCYINGEGYAKVEVEDRFSIETTGDSILQAMGRLYVRMMFALNSFRLQRFEGETLVQEMIYREAH